MRKITNVRPKELKIFNRYFGNLKQFLVYNLPEDECKEFIFTTIIQNFFEYEIVLNLLDERYKQQLEDDMQIALLWNDIKKRVNMMMKNEKI